MSGSKSLSLLTGKAPTPRTGKPRVRDGIASKEGKATYNTLEELLAGLDESPEYKAINDYGLSLLTKDRTPENLALAENMIADSSAKTNRDIGRSLLSRGVGSSGFATTALLGSDAEIRAKMIQDALLRSFGENMQAGQLGVGALSNNLNTKGNFAQLLSNFVSSLLGAGINAKSNAFAVRTQSNNQTADRQLEFLKLIQKQMGGGDSGGGGAPTNSIPVFGG